MKKIFIIMILALVVFSCGSDDDATTGISSNPNFVKGKISFDNGEVMINGYITLSSLSDTLQTTTDSSGYFYIEIDPSETYNIKIIYNDSVVYENYDVASIAGDENLIIKIKAKVVSDDVISDTSKGFLTEFNYFDSYIQFSPSGSNFDSLNSFSVESSEVGYISTLDIYTRYIAKIDSITTFVPTTYSKVAINYTINTESLNNDDTVKAYLLLKRWSNEVTAIECMKGCTWDDKGIGFNTYDAEITPFFIGSTKDIISNGILTLDITKAYDSWNSGKDNYGFVLTFSEKNNSNSILINSIESSSKPILIVE